MSAWQDGFKVVRMLGGHYFSAVRYDGPSCLRYKIGAATKPMPKCGPLAVFASLMAAKEFQDYLLGEADKDETYKVFRCWYTRSRQSYLYVTDRYYRCTAVSLPQGTVLATRVIIVEEVHNV